MADRLKELLSKILEWWNKFSAKQKTLIAGIAIAVIIGLAFVVKVLTTPTMITIQNCKDTKEAAHVIFGNGYGFPIYKVLESQAKGDTTRYVMPFVTVDFGEIKRQAEINLEIRRQAMEEKREEIQQEEAIGK